MNTIVNQNDSIEVSIICNSYNHSKYIADAIESFIMQKTSFKYEILIHDDASTDNTADIIMDYAKRYPDLIFPICQTENQRSKGVQVTYVFQTPRARGKYLAICEGDDYWLDPNKLQRQYDAMEKHPEVDICAHAAISVVANTKKELVKIAPKSEDTIIPVCEVIFGEGGFVATNSLFYRAELNNTFPEFRKCLTLDYTNQIHGSLRGGMLYLKDCMSAYRYMADGSWSSRMAKDKASWNRIYDKKQEMLSILDKETDNKYHDVIKRRQLLNEFTNVFDNNPRDKRLKEIYKAIYEDFPMKQRLIMKFKMYFPGVFNFMLKVMYKG